MATSIKTTMRLLEVTSDLSFPPLTKEHLERKISFEELYRKAINEAETELTTLKGVNHE